MDLGDRTILLILGPAPLQTYHQVGRHGVENITVEYENGQMANVPWFAVWKKGKVWRRYNAALIEAVEYEDD